MHHMRLKSALEKFQPKIAAGAGPDEIESELKSEEYGYSEEEQKEIIDALHKANSGSTSSQPPASTGKPHDTIEPKAVKSQFNYDDLKGEEFKNYMNHIKSLNGNEKRTFKLMRVEVIKKVRYKGIKDSPVDVIGVRIKDSKPIMTTLIPVKAATSQNGFIHEDEDGVFFELLGSQVETNNRFYFLQ